ncbi:MAG TPA: hypothetical protein VHL11_25570, partial [Phototrophicaceae bacterium]|nr:hypothetical protein [Phototrophicaceae bacterium]
MAIQAHRAVPVRQPDAPSIVIGQNLHKDFQLGDQWVHALRGVNVRIPQGQFICIMGPSGS